MSSNWGVFSSAQNFSLCLSRGRGTDYWQQPAGIFCKSDAQLVLNTADNSKTLTSCFTGESMFVVFWSVTMRVVTKNPLSLILRGENQTIKHWNAFYLKPRLNLFCLQETASSDVIMAWIFLAVVFQCKGLSTCFLSTNKRRLSFEKHNIDSVSKQRKVNNSSTSRSLYSSFERHSHYELCLCSSTSGQLYYCV